MARRPLSALAVAAVALGALAAAPPADAAGAPPVTAPDRAVVRADEPTLVDVLANDTDPDGERLEVCRLGPLPRALRYSAPAAGQVAVAPGPRARGRFTITYYACDSTSLTPGTLTVRIRPPRPTLDAFPVDGLPGKLRIVNQLKRSFRCSWRGVEDDTVQGRVTVPAQSTVVVQVRTSDVELECVSGNSVQVIGYVTLSGRAVPVQRYSANASSGGHAQTRLRSP